MGIEEKIHNCQKSLDEIKASQLLGESNYEVYTYIAEDEYTIGQRDELWFEFEYKSNIDAFTIASFDINLYINGQKETFGACSRGFENWEYQSNLFPSLAYEYGITQNVAYINVGNIGGDLYSTSDNSEWVGKKARLVVKVKASRPGNLTVTHNA